MATPSRLHEVFHQQAFHHFSADDVLAKDFLRVLDRRHVVPHRFRVNDDARALLAMLQAARAVDPDFVVLQAGLLGAFLERLEHFLGAALLAAAARVVRSTLVQADEYMALIAGLFFHAGDDTRGEGATLSST